MTIRILLVDDFEPWRRMVCLMVQEESDMQIISEVSDGLAAVQSADELKPDLILMDLSLPKVDGMAAARTIRKIAPKSKILFLSQESSPDVVREALQIGTGFVVKADASKELLPAIKAVFGGKRFLSGRLDGRTFRKAMGVLVPAELD
jgi:DNA-binding NarL/FixJ family response regulator